MGKKYVHTHITMISKWFQIIGPDLRGSFPGHFSWFADALRNESFEFILTFRRRIWLNGRKATHTVSCTCLIILQIVLMLWELIEKCFQHTGILHIQFNKGTKIWAFIYVNYVVVVIVVVALARMSPERKWHSSQTVWRVTPADRSQ